MLHRGDLLAGLSPPDHIADADFRGGQTGEQGCELIGEGGCYFPETFPDHAQVLLANGS